MSNGHDVNNIEEKAALQETLRSKLQGKQGKELWSTFDELADTPEFQQWVEDEVPNRASLLNVDRRKFFQIGASALALAGLSGCRIIPPSRAVPYVREPEEMVPGVPMTYATALSRGGYATGVFVKCTDGRPLKVEGNPAHPASLGATQAWEQAEILNMYDPERSQMVKNRMKPGVELDIAEGASWDQALGTVRRALIDRATNNGAGLALLTETITSPTLATQIRNLLRKFPQAKWVQYEPINRDNVYQGTQLAFNRPLNPVYRLRSAKVVLSLDADFFTDMPGSIRYAREFAEGRRIRKSNPKMNRLYTIESVYSVTGAASDHRLAVKPSEVELVARALYGALTGGSISVPASVPEAWLTAVVNDLKANSGEAVVIPGEQTTPATQALCHAINAALNAIGSTVVYTEPVEGEAQIQTAALKALVDEMNAGKVQTLLILGGNPVYTAPADFAFATAMDKVPLRVHLSQYDDETSAYCHWHLPEAHPFEAWSDVRAFDGTVTIAQPLIAPLYKGKSAVELMSDLVGEPRIGYEVIRANWKSLSGTGNFEAWWEKAVHDGVVPNTALPTVTATIRPDLLGALPEPTAGSDLEIAFRPDPSLWDGRWANNSWLQELPKPITTICWDNVAIISPATAKKLKLVVGNSEDMMHKDLLGRGAEAEETDAIQFAQIQGKKVIELSVNGGTLTMPVWILPGQPNDTITVHLGFGRTKAGAVGNKGESGGFNTYQLRTSGTMAYATGLTVKDTGLRYNVVYTQPHHTMRGVEETENRPIVKHGTLADYIAKNGEILKHVHVPEYLVATGYGSALKKSDHGGGEHGGEHGSDHEGEHGGHDAPLNPSHGFTNSKVVGETPYQGKEAYADPLRNEWRYAEKSMSNKDGMPSLYPEFSNKGFNAWAMSIDLTTCIGCNACVAACQAENNIPTVGKSEVGRGREMHWIRIDHYYATDQNWDDVESYFQPVMCLHCEKAPCEPVCPVAATIHSHEGINQMVYNRCIGTRYCSNNCPYKVRRFNFLKWVGAAGGPTTLDYYGKPQLKMMTNPDVTLRGRGVMEKCTYCVQRINRVRIEAKTAGREIQDGDVVVACEQVCPTQAIVFGDINNSNSRVSKLRHEPADYSLLSDLNTRPRTTYMAKIKNLNPEIVALTPTETPAEVPAAPGVGGEG
jgi:molybdopterin-containing oxidoreductase family iron-sulfur binding subunit